MRSTRAPCETGPRTVPPRTGMKYRRLASDFDNGPLSRKLSEASVWNPPMSYANESRAIARTTVSPTGEYATVAVVVRLSRYAVTNTLQSAGVVFTGQRTHCRDLAWAACASGPVIWATGVAPPL